MPYQRTGNPPGRPRKQPTTAPVNAEAPPATPVNASGDATPKILTRAHKGFQRVYDDPRDDLYRPPRWKRRNVGRRPILHPHVIRPPSET